MAETIAPPEPPVEPPSRAELPGMSFLEHLEELRRRILYSLVGVAAGFGVAWYYAERIYAYVQVPVIEALRAHHKSEQLVYLNPTEPFNLYLKVGLLAGVFLASPFILYQVWAFISPGLYRNEKRYVLPFMFSTVGLFVGGGLFGYHFVYPAALDFFIGFSKQMRPMITIGAYLDLFTTIMLGLGVVFEMPVLVFFLALFGIVSPSFLVKNFRYAILGIFIVAAAIAPTPDIMSVCVFAAPMLVLYAVSIGVAWMVHPSRRKKTA